MKTVIYRLITNMIPESIMDSSFSVCAVSNMGRMAKLTTKWSFRAVLWIDEQALLASKSVGMLWGRLQRIIPARKILKIWNARKSGN